MDRTPGFERTSWRRALDFWNDEIYELRGSELIRIDAPTDASVSIHREWLLIELRTDWIIGTASYTAGSLLAADYDEFLAGTAELQVVFEPDEHTACITTRGPVTGSVIVTLADVASRVEIVTPGSWQREPVTGVSRPPPTPSSPPPTTPAMNSSSTPADSTRRRGCCAAPATGRWSRSSPRQRSSTPKTSL